MHTAARRLSAAFYVLLLASSATLGVMAPSCSSGVGPDGPVVGSPCDETLDCAEGSVCLLDPEDFPDGMCATSCRSQADCEEGSRCVDVQGGHCLLDCSGGASCATGVGCRGKRNVGDSMDSEVCINDDN